MKTTTSGEFSSRTNFVRRANNFNPLSHFRASLPYLAVCGSSKRDHRILPRQIAAALPYVQINRKVPNRYGRGMVARISHVVLDLDYDLDGVDWEDRGAPGPDLLAQNPEKRGGHFFLQLAKPVFVPDGARVRKWHEGIARKPFELYLAVEHYLKHALNADRSLRCLKCKSPIHPDHEVTVGGRGYARSLSELCEWIDWKWIDEEIDRGCLRPPNGQHDQLYMDALYFACDHAKEFEDVYQLIDFCHLHESGIHGFESMPAADVKSTFKSACGDAWARRDTWKVYAGRGTVKPAPIEPEEVRRRQQESARNTAIKRREKTLARLLDVARGIGRLTKAGLVSASGLTWNTVVRYWNQIKEAICGESTRKTKMASSSGRSSTELLSQSGSFSTTSHVSIHCWSAKILTILRSVTGLFWRSAGDLELGVLNRNFSMCGQAAGHGTGALALSGRASQAPCRQSIFKPRRSPMDKAMTERLSEVQSKASARSSRIKRAKSVLRVARAFHELADGNSLPTKADVYRQIGFSANTVYRYWDAATSATLETLEENLKKELSSPSYHFYNKSAPEHGDRQRAAASISSARSRCINPNNPLWKYYGGRGISVCDRWRNSTEAFLEDMGGRVLGMTLERVDVNGNYEPSNCKWLPSAEQNANRRVVTWMESDIGPLPMNRWAKHYKLSYSRVHKYVKKKQWSEAKILKHCGVQFGCPLSSAYHVLEMVLD